MENFLNAINFIQLNTWDINRIFQNDGLEGMVPLSSFLKHYQKIVSKEEAIDKHLYIVSKISFGGTLYLNDFDKIYTVKGSLYEIPKNAITYSKINVRHGCCYWNTTSNSILASSEYPTFLVDENKVLPEYLIMVLRHPRTLKQFNSKLRGFTKARVSVTEFLLTKIPLPSIERQKELVAQYNASLNLAKDKENQADTMEQSIDDYLMAELGIKENLPSTSNGLFQTVEYKDLSNWDIKTLKKNQNFLSSSKYSSYKCSQILSINPSTVLPSDKNTEISFIPMENVSDVYGKVMHLDKKNVTMAKGYTKFKNGDLIWAKITPCMQNGKSAVVDNLLNGYGCGSTEFYVIRNDKVTEKLNTNFLHLLLRMKLVLNEAMKTFTGACGQQRVPVGFIKELQIPLPPLSVQIQILEEILLRKEQIKNLRDESEKLRSQALSDFEKEVFN